MIPILNWIYPTFDWECSFGSKLGSGSELARWSYPQVTNAHSAFLVASGTLGPQK